jgi:hypothetical protein
MLTNTSRRSRFKPGDEVYCRQWSDAGKVTGVAGGLVPSYWVVDPDGHEWKIAQILLRSKPFPIRRAIESLPDADS